MELTAEGCQAHLVSSFAERRVSMNDPRDILQDGAHWLADDIADGPDIYRYRLMTFRSK